MPLLDEPVVPPAAAPSVEGPLVQQLGSGLQAEEVFETLSGLPNAVFFDSAMRHSTLGRYSYVAADPFDWWTVPADGQPAIEPAMLRVNRWRVEPIAGLPPWQGGAALLFGYEVGRSLERLDRPRWDEFRQPALAAGLYDTAVLFDHATDRAWAVSHGFPEPPGASRQRRAESRLAELLERLRRPPARCARGPREELLASALAPQHATPYGRGVTSDFSRDGYLRAVDRVVERLRAGVAFQVNLSQRLLTPAPADPVAAYLRLRERNPAPFSAYLDGGAWQVASASPERFLRVTGASVETRPIKGTRPLPGGAEDRRRSAAALCASEKDRAENVMIVDLLRNDLSRVAVDASVDVPTLFGVEEYAHVQHLVSVVTAQLRDGAGVGDLLAATLPGGSITGAPKVSAQQIIASREPTSRGAYCGSLACVGFPEPDGRQAMDSSVLIRTITLAGGWAQAPVGGGVVVQSDPVAEYDETWHKAAGLIDAVAP
ncbi:MAG: anthranilate synthase component I family protein [Planctomycetota bacterium]